MNMKLLAALAAGIGLLAAVACGDGDDVNVTVPPDQPLSGITVTGEGRVTIEPDLARLNLGVEVREENADQALVNASGALQNIIDVLTEEGVADEDISTTDVSIQPEYDFSSDTAEISGYFASNTLEAKLRDLDNVGNIIDRATNAGGNATRVNFISFEREDKAEAIEQARQLAAEDARNKAEGLAEGLGVELGSIQAAFESSVNEPPPVPFAAADVAEEGREFETTPISPGTLEVTVTVDVTYAVEE